MTIKELIIELNKYDKNKEIKLHENSACGYHSIIQIRPAYDNDKLIVITDFITPKNIKDLI